MHPDEDGAVFAGIQCDGEQEITVIYAPCGKREQVAGRQRRSGVFRAVTALVAAFLPERHLVQQRVMKLQVPETGFSAAVADIKLDPVHGIGVAEYQVMAPGWSPRQLGRQILRCCCSMGRFTRAG